MQDVRLILIFGVVGYLLRKLDPPLAPAVLATFSRSPDRDVNTSGAIVGRRQFRHLFQSADGYTHHDHYPFAIGDAFIQFISPTAVVVGGYLKFFANTENSLVVASKVREIYSERQSLLFNSWYTIYQ